MIIISKKEAIFLKTLKEGREGGRDPRSAGVGGNVVMRVSVITLDVYKYVIVNLKKIYRMY